MQAAEVESQRALGRQLYSSMFIWHCQNFIPGALLPTGDGTPTHLHWMTDLAPLMER